MYEKKILISAAVLLILLAACQKFSFGKDGFLSNKKLKRMERITFETSDGVAIVGSYTAAQGAKSAALLLHMMPAARQSFESLQKELQKINISSLAIDLRGHGESVKSKTGTLNFQKFQDADHQKSRLDIDAAIKFLESKGFPKNTISIVGASIGANLAIDFLSREPSVKKAVLLSPGLDYRGVLTEPAAKKILVSQKILIVAAKGDSYSAESSERLFEIMGKDKSELIIYDGSEHGTNMWKPNPELIKKIIDFVK